MRRNRRWRTSCSTFKSRSNFIQIKSRKTADRNSPHFGSGWFASAVPVQSISLNIREDGSASRVGSKLMLSHVPATARSPQRPYIILSPGEKPNIILFKRFGCLQFNRNECSIKKWWGSSIPGVQDRGIIDDENLPCDLPKEMQKREGHRCSMEMFGALSLANFGACDRKIDDQRRRSASLKASAR